MSGGGHRVLGFSQIDEVGVATIRRQLPGCVVAADAPDQRLAGAQLDQRKLTEAWQPTILMRDHDLDFQLVRQGRKALQ